MPRAGTDKPYKSFVAGLISDATGLSYPENSCKDLDNLDIDISGKISRRKQFERLVSGGASTLSVVEGANNNATSWAYSTHVGKNIYSGSTSINLTNIICIQYGRYLDVRLYNSFSNIGTQLALIDLYTTFRLTTGLTISDVQSQPIYSVQNKNRMYFVGKVIKAFFIEFDEQASSIVITALAPVIRDFFGVDDTLITGTGITSRPATLTAKHEYNLYNQGWYRTKIDAFFASQAVYPSNSDIWFYAKDTSDNFDPTELVKIDFSNTRAPRGRLLMDVYTGDRDAIANQTDMFTTNQTLTSDEPMLTGFTTVSQYAGRIWFSGDNTPKRPCGVYFSKLIQSGLDANYCYQEASPTAEQLNDIVAIDGGVIYIPDAVAINKLEPMANGILVFSTRGVWYIRGSDAGFSATNYSVDKLSSNGCIAPESVVSAENAVFYWSDGGINAITYDGVTPKVQSLTDGKLQTFYNSILPRNKEFVHGFYHLSKKQVVWQYRSVNDIGALDNRFFYPNILLFDIKTGAFWKHSLTEPSNSSGANLEIYRILPAQFIDTYFPIGVYPVVKILPNFSPKGVVIEGYTFSEIVDNRQFLDWKPTISAGVNYSSYLETGDETLDDLQREKQTTYLHSFFERTETAIASTGPTVFNYPSACNMRYKWEWHTTNAGNRWSDLQSVYAFRRPVTSPSVGAFDNGEGVVFTKRRLRGQGRAASIRYESVTGKDFRLLGFSTAVTSNAL